MKDYTNKDCCLNCAHFTWWDGDYVCMADMKIHQYGFGNDYKGYSVTPYMNESIDITMETSDTCDEYEKCINDWVIDEYKKYKKLDKLCKQLEAYVK